MWQKNEFIFTFKFVRNPEVLFQNKFFFSPNWCEDSIRLLRNSFLIMTDFISTDQEESLFKEVEPHLKRQVYEKDHWDEVKEKQIHF